MQKRFAAADKPNKGADQATIAMQISTEQEEEVPLHILKHLARQKEEGDESEKCL